MIEFRLLPPGDSFTTSVWVVISLFLLLGDFSRQLQETERRLASSVRARILFYKVFQRALLNSIFVWVVYENGSSARA